jgi:hypothetical protein
MPSKQPEQEVSILPLLLIGLLIWAWQDKSPQPVQPVDPVAPVVPVVPEPVRTFRVIFVKESGETLSAAQTPIPSAKAIREYLNAKTTREGNQPGWREYDPQQNTTNEQPTMAALWEAVKPKLQGIPCMVIEVNGRATVMPFPADVDAALAALKRAGGA